MVTFFCLAIYTFYRPQYVDVMIPSNFYNSSKSEAFKIIFVHMEVLAYCIYLQKITGHLTFVKITDQKDILSFGLQNS